ncbi:MAG: hypothetical protein AAFS00_09750, partial [Bacteroidota bacterium]
MKVGKDRAGYATSSFNPHISILTFRRQTFKYNLILSKITYILNRGGEDPGFWVENLKKQFFSQ